MLSCFDFIPLNISFKSDGYKYSLNTLAIGFSSETFSDEQAKIKAQQLVDEAIDSVSIFGEKADFMIKMARTILERNN